MADTISPSILNTIKKMFGLSETDVSFDLDLVVHINSVLMTLAQLGVGPTEPILITDKTDLWTTFFGAETNLGAVKTYIYLKVKLVFDPPSNGFLVDAIESQLTELEFRLNVQAEPRPPAVVEEEEEEV
jgi:hypothetical protein